LILLRCAKQPTLASITHHLYFMKKSVLILSIIFIAQFSMAQQKPKSNSTYEAAWQKIEQLIQKNKTQDALAAINKIITKADAENNVAEKIKAICFYENSNGKITENHLEKTIQRLEDEVRKSQGVEQQIWLCYTAEMYWRYYNQFRWQISEITKVEEKAQPENIKEWSSDQFLSKIISLYDASLANEKLLQAEPIKKWLPLIEKGSNPLPIMQTMYEVLMEKALQFYKDDRIEIREPSYAFTIDAAQGFADEQTFRTTTIKTSDTNSCKYKALTMYQALLNYFTTTNNINAKIKTDLQRLEYVQSKNPSKTEIHHKAIEKIYNQNKQNKYAQLGKLHIAKSVQNNVDEIEQYGDDDDSQENKWNGYNGRLEAKKIIDEILMKPADEEVKQTANQILNELQFGFLKLQTESVYLPNENCLANVIFKNIKTVYCYIVPLPNNINSTFTENKVLLKKNPSIIPSEITLPTSNDYRMHSTDFKIDPLAMGRYRIIITNTKNHQQKNALIAGTTVAVSTIGAVELEQVNESPKSLVLMNRKTGEPIANAMVDFYMQSYVTKTRSYIYQKNNTAKSGVNGFVQLPQSNQEIHYTIKSGNDVFISNNSIYNYKQNIGDKPKSTNEMVLFTDRNIYRPNQTIFFKGILIRKDFVTFKTSVVANEAVEITLHDANDQTIATKKLKTNEYGSIADSFDLKDGLLTGSFSIQYKNDRVYVRVEEYKRPKFYVDMDTIKKAYQLNEKVTVTGTVKQMNDIPLPNVIVSYRVNRNTRWIYDWCKWRGDNSSNQEIADGEIKTDKNGKFSIEFTALPDAEIDRKTLPIFDFEINVDASDINGETHDKQTTVAVGYQSVVLQVDVPNDVAAGDSKQLVVQTNNINDVFVPSQVTITCAKLKAENSFLKEKKWATPDQFIYSKTEFKQLFPLDEYANENEAKNWAIDQQIFTKTITTTQDGMVPIEALPNEDAYYFWTISTIDKSGDTITEKKWVRIYKNQNAGLLGNESIEIRNTGNDNEFRPMIPAIAKHLLQVQTIGDLSPTYQWQLFAEANKRQTYKPILQDQLGRTIAYGYFLENRFYHNSITKQTIAPGKKFDVQIATFRNKIEPGSQQTWSVKINGDDKEKINAELLTSMYDASLDELKGGNWERIPNGTYNFYNYRTQGNPFNDITEKEDASDEENDNIVVIGFADNRLVNYCWENPIFYKLNIGSYAIRGNALAVKSSLNFSANAQGSVMMDANSSPMNDSMTIVGENESVGFIPPIIKKDEEELDNKKTKSPKITIRKNFQETAFWLPQLHTDADGNIQFTFTTPDALTKWKWRMLAHTKDLRSQQKEQMIVTQKELMVVTNNVRFYRNGDQAIYSAKVVNASQQTLSGNAQLSILDANSEKNIDGLFSNIKNNQSFTLEAGESKSFDFAMQIPANNASPILAKFIAVATSKSGLSLSDGEQNMIPILSNVQLLTESRSFSVRGGQTKSIEIPNLMNASKTSQAHSLTIESASNPSWYAVQSLPYLMEYPHECAEQSFNRMYAHLLANKILLRNPLFAKTIEEWNKKDTTALLSNLQKNQELKSVLLQETPWVLEATSENEQRKNLAKLLDTKANAQYIKAAYEQLAKLQTPDGGFAWFGGDKSNDYITQYILTGFGKLYIRKVLTDKDFEQTYTIVEKALEYADEQFVKRHQQFKKQSKKDNQVVSEFDIQYMYMRSYFTEFAYDAKVVAAKGDYLALLKKQAFQQSLMMQAMSAIVLHRNGLIPEAKQVLDGIQQNAMRTDEDGMYWKNNVSGYAWYQAPIETHTMVMECFAEIMNDYKTVDELKIWLLKNKQTNRWASTKSTADAIYGLLLQGSSFVENNAELSVTVADQQLSIKDYQMEAGTGYSKIKYANAAITPSMGKVQVSNTNTKSPLAWGAVYYQYFEQFNNVVADNSDMRIEKKLMLVQNTATGEELKNIPSTGLTIGDKVRVRLVLTINKDMDFVHVKDMRAACFEPLNVLSEYNYQNGLGYYQSTKDVATHFFFDYISKGTYVFEYDLFATNKGTYTNGISSIECMYAPEFTAHSNGVTVTVNGKN
jgi:Bacterial Alpha-2-macroglobulin MG10 domain/MG2 domain/Alpha-2-macroglobulin family